MTRMEQLMQRLPEGIDCAWISADVNRRYFTGMASSAGNVICFRDGAYLLIDFRYIEKARACVKDCQVIELENLSVQVENLLQQHHATTIAVESAEMTLQQFSNLQKRFSHQYTWDTSNVLSDAIKECRMVKTPDEIEQIQAAMEQNCKISFSYFAPSGTTSREIEPYHLIFQWGHWYVWGYCDLRQDYRLFKLTRITDLQIEPEQRAARSVPAYTPDPMPPEEPAVPVLVRFSAAVKWRVMDDFGTEALQTEPDGGLLVSVCWQDLQALYWRLLAYGEQAEILEPPEARADFAEMLRKILKKYEEPSGGF